MIVQAAARAYSDRAANGLNAHAPIRDELRDAFLAGAAYEEARREDGPETDVAVRVAQEERDAWKQDLEEARNTAERVKAEVSGEEPPSAARIREMMNRIVAPGPRETEAVAAFQAIMAIEARAGYLSGSKHIAEVAVDRAVVFLHRRGKLSDEQVRALGRRGSIGTEVCAVLAAPVTPERVSGTTPDEEREAVWRRWVIFACPGCGRQKETGFNCNDAVHAGRWYRAERVVVEPVDPQPPAWPYCGEVENND